MVVGSLATMAFLFAYTQVRTAAQNVSTRLLELAFNVLQGVILEWRRLEVGLIGVDARVLVALLGRWSRDLVDGNSESRCSLREGVRHTRCHVVAALGIIVSLLMMLFAANVLQQWVSQPYKYLQLSMARNLRSERS